MSEWKYIVRKSDIFNTRRNVYNLYFFKCVWKAFLGLIRCYFSISFINNFFLEGRLFGGCKLNVAGVGSDYLQQNSIIWQIRLADRNLFIFYIRVTNVRKSLRYSPSITLNVPSILMSYNIYLYRKQKVNRKTRTECFLLDMNKYTYYVHTNIITKQIYLFDKIKYYIYSTFVSNWMGDHLGI